MPNKYYELLIQLPSCACSPSGRWLCVTRIYDSPFAETAALGAYNAVPPELNKKLELVDGANNTRTLLRLSEEELPTFPVDIDENDSTPIESKE